MMEQISQHAYAAGFFDGEGTVYIAKGGRRKKWLFSISVVNTNREVIDWFQKTYGGKKYARPATGGWKEKYQWYVFGKAALEFLRQISPYVIVKRDDVAIGIAFAETLRSDNKPISRELSDSRMRMVGEIRKLRRAATTKPSGPETGCDSLNCIDEKDAEVSETNTRPN